MGLMGATSGATSKSCCKKSDESTYNQCGESEEQQEESSCCEGDNCNCACCLHIVYMQQFNYKSFVLNDFSAVKFDYSFLYQADYLKAVFHPPAFL